jgi:hypothetical protein
MKEVINQGLETTKGAINVAAEKAKGLGERGVLKYEISKLEKDVEKNFALIGTHVYNLLVLKGNENISKNTEEIKPLLNEVIELEKKITDRETQLEEIKKEEARKDQERKDGQAKK